MLHSAAKAKREHFVKQVYAKKTVHAIFVDEPGQIVVVTVLVYYHDQ